VGVARALTISASAAVILTGVACASADPRLVGSGLFPGGTWRVLAEARDGQICVDTVFDGAPGGSSSCVRDEDDVPLTTTGSSGGTDRPDIVHGLTRADVTSVKVETRIGAVQASTVEVPALSGAPFSRRGFAVAVPAFSVLLAITAFDAAGHVLERSETGMTP
jgi:hypothetical protein